MNFRIRFRPITWRVWGMRAVKDPDELERREKLLEERIRRAEQI